MSGKFSATKTFMCLLISDRWVTPSSSIFLTCSFTHLSTGLYKLANWKQKMYHKEPRLMFYFLLSCYPNSFTDLDFFMLVDVICIYRTWYWPWFSCTAGWGRRMYITHFTGDRPWTKSALLRYASTRDIDRSLSWNVKQIIYYEEYASS